MGVINHSVEFPLVITGIESGRVQCHERRVHFAAGPFLRDPDDILVDPLYAKQKKLQPGAPSSFLNQPGICWHYRRRQTGSHCRAHRALAETFSTPPGKVTQIYLKLDNPANARRSSPI